MAATLFTASRFAMRLSVHDRAVTLDRVGEKVSSGLLRMNHWAQAHVHRRTLGAPSPHHEEIISNLLAEGVHVTSVERLFPDVAKQILDSLVRAASYIATECQRAESPFMRRLIASTDLLPDELLKSFPDLYLLGLDPRIIALAEHYFGLPVAYHGVALRQSFTNGNQVGPRLWHMDSEDFHVFRVVIYLCDVTPGGGPFEYVPRNSGLSYTAFPGIGGITDERMRTVMPERQWKRCVGPMGTVILADSAKIFHHESLRVNRSRTVAMIGYSSQRPKGMQLAMSHFPVESLRPTLMRLVSPAHYPHVFNWRRAAF
jgi:hypothetical protein